MEQQETRNAPSRNIQITAKQPTMEYCYQAALPNNVPAELEMIVKRR